MTNTVIQFFDALICGELQGNIMSEKKGVMMCSEAVVNHYGVTFGCLGKTLEKLNSKQEVLTVGVHKEREILDKERDERRLEQMISVTNIYKTKLDKIKEDMEMLTNRSARLRQRAERLQEEKQRESLEREVRRDKERIREKELIAKPAPGANIPPE